MEVFKIVILALAAVMLIMVVKDTKSGVQAVFISLFVGALVFLMVLPKISAILQVFSEMAHKAQVNEFYLSTVLKIIGISYIAEFGAQVCRDAGEGAIANKVQFGAKIIIMVLAVPIIIAILESVMRLLA